VKNFKRLFLFACVLSVGSSGIAQKLHNVMVKSYAPKQSFKHFITKTPWIIQLGGNVVDDDGKPYKNVFDVKNAWNINALSLKLAIEKELNYNWNIELAINTNAYKSGKIINGNVITSSGNFFSVDLNGKKIITKAYRIEPYLFSGFGYTMRTVSKYKDVATLNAGFGFNIWAIDNVLGINIQGAGKFGLMSPLLKTGSNYLQHSAGIIYKFSGNAKQLKAARKHISSIYNK